MSDVLYLTPKALSLRWLGMISEKTLANWRCANKGPRFKRFGSRIMYPLEFVEAWEAEQSHDSTSEYSARERSGTAPIHAVHAPLTRADIRALKKVAANTAAELAQVELAIEALAARREEVAAEHTKAMAALQTG